jgi:hypothetical protein
MTGPEPEHVSANANANAEAPAGGAPASDPRHWTLPRAVRLDDLGPLDEPISEHNGQAVAVRPLANHPGWLAKLYRPDQHPHPEDARRLDGLISAPDGLPTSERAALYAGTCWPAARIHGSGNPVVGCVIPKAPEEYRAELRRGAFSERRFVEIDWLAKPDESIERIGLPSPGLAGRLAACRHLTELAAILETLGLVYSDWSFSNAFWSPEQDSVYLIDVDGCRPEKMPDIHQPNWADPLTPQGTPADGYTDRYRLALLVAKCLTGRRDADAFHAVAASPWPYQRPASEVLLDMLLGTDRERRPSSAQLNQALNDGPYLRPVPRPARSALPAAPPPAALPPSPLPSSPLPGERPQSRTSGVPRVQQPTPVRRKPATTQLNGWAAVLLIAVLLILVAVLSNH